MIELPFGLLKYIDRLLNISEFDLEDWNEEWDGVIGDLSAPEYYSIKTRIFTLKQIKFFITEGDRRQKNLGGRMTPDCTCTICSKKIKSDRRHDRRNYNTYKKHSMYDYDNFK